MSLISLPKDLIQQIALCSTPETVAALAQVNCFFYSCLDREWFWLELLARDYPDYCYQPDRLSQMREEALCLLEKQNKRTLEPVARYHPRQIYQVLHHLTHLRIDYESLLQECEVYHSLMVIDLRSPLVLLINEPYRDRKVLEPTSLLRVHLNGEEQYSVDESFSLVSKRGVLYPKAIRGCLEEDRVMPDRTALLGLLQQIVKSGFLLCGERVPLPPALVKGNQYVLEYNSK